MTLQNILTLSIDVIALSFAAIMIIDFALVISKAWCKSANHKRCGICAETLAPIFEDVPEVTMSTITEILEPTLIDTPSVSMCTGSTQIPQFSIRELKKQASVAKIKNYSLLTKAQLVEALSV